VLNQNSKYEARNKIKMKIANGEGQKVNGEGKCG